MHRVAEGHANFNLLDEEEAGECKMLEAIMWDEFSETEKTADGLKCGFIGDCFFY